MLSTSSTNGIRKTDDRWVYTTSLNRKAAKNWYYTLAGQIKSQFTDGYTYLADGGKSLGSALFSPGDVKLGLGFTYQPNADFSAYISPATAKMMLRLDHRFIHTTLFGVDSNKTSAFDMGAFARLDYKKEIKKDLMYTASLDVFYGYVLKNYNFYLGNLINWKLNKYFGATFGLDIAYDNTQPTPNFGKDPVTGKEIITGTSVKMQLKEIFGLGFNYTF